MNKNFITAAAVMALGAGFAQAQEIGTWAGFRSGAASFTFDDGAPSHVSDVGPMFEKYGYRATFNLVVNWGPDWSGFQKLADKGHDIASHSNSHPQVMSGEEASSKSSIEGKIKQEYGCIIVAYPNCKVPNTSSVLQNYAAGRICNGSWENVSDIVGKDGPSDWAKVPAFMTGSEGSIKSTGDFTGQMQKASQQSGWVQFLTHGLSGKNNGSATYSPTDPSAIEGALKWANENDSKIWVAPMRDVVMYIKERKASKITAGASSATSMTFTLTHSIADNISKYNYPLSVRVKSDWSKVTATQGGKALAASIKDGYIYFDAVPNGGDIVLSSDGAAVTPASCSSDGGETPASSSSVGASPFKGAIAVPGTVEAENYDVNAFSRSSTESGTTGYRNDDAGVVAADVGNALGYTTAGDYFEYTIDVKTAGKYKVTVRGATGNASDGSVTLEAGASSVKVPVATTGDWNVYSESAGDEIQLSAGKQTLRLTINDNYLNVDWIKLTSDGSSPSEAVHAIRLDVNSGMVQCQVFDMNGQLVTAGKVLAGSAHDIWKRVSENLGAGVYIMRYGAGKSMQSVRIRK